jgi:CheY-like chemotaxis protein
MADPTRIHQVIMNLCTNAAHAMREHGGVMDLSLSNCDVEDDGFTAPVKGLEPGAYVRLIVSDTGHGMDRETAKMIFDPYFTTKGRGEGTGLGLSVVHGIVAKLGGAVSVYSEPGKGTALHVYLPRIHTDDEALKIPANADIAGGTETILLVDDEADILEMTGEMLENLGYSVVSRTNGAEAFQAFAANPQRFDLVITDYTMPGMTGLELAEKITGLGCDTPTILCSGFSADISSRRADASGLRAILKKPILKREMAESIRRVLD